MTLRYEVVPGDGMVARYGDSIVWVGTPVDSEAWEALGAVLELGPGEQPDGSDTAGRLDSLQRVLDEHPRTVLAALVIDGDQAQGVLRGPVTVRNATDIAPATGHDQFGVTVPFPMSEAVYVGFHQPGGNPSTSAGLLDLDAGVVPGAGAWVHPVTSGRRHAGGDTSSASASIPQVDPADVPADPQPPAPEAAPEQSDPPSGSPIGWPSGAGAPPPPGVTVSSPGFAEPPGLAGPGVAGPPSFAEPADSAERPAGGPATEQRPAHPVTGEHQAQPQDLPPVDSSGTWATPAAGPDAPTSAASAESGTSFVPAADHQRIDLREVAAPATVEPLPPISGPDASASPAGPASSGIIVFDDGSTFSLDRDYVIGRRPEKDARVQSGAAEALTVVDPDSVLSSAHALVSRRGGEVLLRDLGSLNGTHVAPPGASDWTKLEQHQEVPIVAGTRLLFGWTIATFAGPDDNG